MPLNSQIVALNAIQEAVGSANGGALLATASLLSGGIANAVAPTLTAGTQSSLLLDLAGNLKVAVNPVSSAIVSNSVSGSITAGGTAQVLVAANPNLKKLIVQNPTNATESIFIDFGAYTSDDVALEIEPGQKLILDGAVPSDAIYINAATTGHKFSAKWW